MKKFLFTLAFGFALIGCGTMYDTYDGGYGYSDYTYGYGHDYVIYNNGYRYGYEAGVIDAITNRMVLAMALDQVRAARLLELNRRYFYLFHSMPNYSFGYYNFNPGPPPPPRGPVGPGYYGDQTVLLMVGAMEMVLVVIMDVGKVDTVLTTT